MGRLRFTPGVALIAALAACGGGADGDPGYEINVRFLRSPLTIPTFDDYATPGSACTSATLSPVPDSVAAIRLFDAGGAFQASSATIADQGNGSFQACLPLQKLSAGVHSGTLTLQICKDVACSQLYRLSQSTLPYAITVYHAVSGLPPLAAEIRVDDAVPASVSEGLAGEVRTYRVAARVGQSIRVTPSEPFVLMQVTSASLTPTSSPVGSFTVTAKLPAGAASAMGHFGGRAADGRTVRVNVDVAP